MGMAAILVMWPEPFEQLFVPLIPGGYIWNLVTIGPVVSEEKLFEIVDGRRRTTDDDGRRTTTDDGACLYYKLPGAFGSGELKTFIPIKTKAGNNERLCAKKPSLSKAQTQDCQISKPAYSVK